VGGERIPFGGYPSKVLRHVMNESESSRRRLVQEPAPSRLLQMNTLIIRKHQTRRHPASNTPMFLESEELVIATRFTVESFVPTT
jgi:hypothetical protein